MALGAIGLREAVGSVAVEPEARPLTDGIVSGGTVLSSGSPRIERERRGRTHRALLLILLTAIATIALNACRWQVATRTESPATASAEILGTRIFVHHSHEPAIQKVTFHVPRAGEARLRLNNGAKIDSRSEDRIEEALVRLNGKEIAGPSEINEDTNILHLPVKLKAGPNELSFELDGQPGQRISARIDAPADTLRLEPVQDTLLIGEALQPKATLTGLGRPVRDVAVAFRVKGLGKTEQRTASTGRTGTASIRLSGFQRAGKGKLIARTVGVVPALADTVPLQVVKTPSVELGQSFSRTALEVGQSKPVSFFIDYLKEDTKTYDILFAQTVEPRRDGITLETKTPPEGLLTSGPSSFIVGGTITGRTPGTYTITSRATVKQTGESTSTRLKVKVSAPQPAEELVLGPPAFVPAAVTVDEPTPVRFASVASGVTKYPAAFTLQEFDPASKLWKAVPDGQLHDDGRNGDMIAGDRIYARRLEVTGTAEGEKRYRVVSSENAKSTVSQARVLKITRFPVGAAEGDFQVIEDNETGRRFVAEQVAAGFLPGVTEERIQAIVSEATQKATGQAGAIIGYIPQIRVVQVGLAVDPSAPDAVRVAAVEATVAELQRYDAVRYAEPNGLLTFAADSVTPDGDSTQECITVEEYLPDGTPVYRKGQWAVHTIGADKAWSLVGPPTGTRKVVAVVDTGVAPSSDANGDLCWQSLSSDTRDPADCDDENVNVFSESSNSENDEGHGTAVAGIIAARHHGDADGQGAIGISGIAHFLPVISYDVGAAIYQDALTATAIEEAAKVSNTADNLEVGIINVSSAFDEDDDHFNAFKSAVEYATCPGDTDDDDPPDEPPCDCERTDPETGRCRLLVVSAQNQGNQINDDGPVYPCLWSFPALLCVASTDDDDMRALHSNYGDAVDLSAPGVNICTTSADSAEDPSGYTVTYGTSLAAPHVSGAAAVLWSMKTGLTAVEVAERLKATVDPINVAEPHAGKMGSGRLNLAAAVNYVIAPDLSHESDSWPRLTAEAGAWTEIYATQARPADEGTLGKGGLVVAYDTPEFNPQDFTLRTTEETIVELHPGSGADTDPCDEVADTDSIPRADLGKCFFQIDGKIVRIYYIGNLTVGQEIRYAISGLSANYDLTVAEFKSEDFAEEGPIPLDSRAPARLVLVLDKSGSMARSSRPDYPACEGYSTPQPGEVCAPRRWKVLQDAVDATLAVAQAYALPEYELASGELAPGDEFAVAFFDSDVGQNNKEGFVSLETINDFLDIGRDPGGSTSVGAGMIAFQGALGDEDPSTYHQTILLFTDGEQNTAPYLVTDGSEVFINETNDSAVGLGDQDKFAPGVVDICPFALRTDYGSVSLDFDTIAGRCNGLRVESLNIGPTNPDLVQFFLEVLHQALIGDKLELVQVTSGQIERNEQVSAVGDFMVSRKDVIKRHERPAGTETFTTSREDMAFTLLVTWAEPGNGLGKVMLTKDGVNFPVTGVPNRILTSSGDTYMAITLRRPYCRHDGKCVKSEGKWKLHMQPSFKSADTFTYNLFVTTDNATLASEFRVLQPERGVGQPLRITASLTEAGQPIRDLPPGSVRAVLSRPAASLGNVLSRANAVPVKAPEADPVSAAGRKAAAMLADPYPCARTSLLDALEPSVHTEMVLKESAPGLYEADYKDTRVSGAYVVRFHVNGRSAGNGSFTRTFLTTRSVEVIADEKATRRTVRVSRTTPCRLPGGCYAISLAPVDAAGNLLGPGKANLITVRKFSGQMLGPVLDQLDGRYTIRIGYPEPGLENPVIEIPGARLTVELQER